MGKSPCFRWVNIFNSYVTNYQRVKPPTRTEFFPIWMESVPTEIAMLDPQGNSHGTGSKSQSPAAHIPNMNIPKLRWDVNNNPYPFRKFMVQSSVFGLWYWISCHSHPNVVDQWYIIQPRIQCVYHGVLKSLPSWYVYIPPLLVRSSVSSVFRRVVEPQPSATPKKTGGCLAASFQDSSDLGALEQTFDLFALICLENHGKPWKTMENHGKPWKTMENHGKP